MCAAFTVPAVDASVEIVRLQHSVSRPCAARNVNVPPPVNAVETGVRVASNRRPPLVGVMVKPRQNARAAARVCGTPVTTSPWRAWPRSCARVVTRTAVYRLSSALWQIHRLTEAASAADANDATTMDAATAKTAPNRFMSPPRPAQLGSFAHPSRSRKAPETALPLHVRNEKLRRKA